MTLLWMMLLMLRHILYICLCAGRPCRVGSEQFRFFKCCKLFYDVIQRAIVMFYSFVGWYNDDDDGWEEACRGAVQIEW